MVAFICKLIIYEGGSKTQPDAIGFLPLPSDGLWNERVIVILFEVFLVEMFSLEMFLRKASIRVFFLKTRKVKCFLNFVECPL